MKKMGIDETMNILRMPSCKYIRTCFIAHICLVFWNLKNVRSGFEWQKHGQNSDCTACKVMLDLGFMLYKLPATLKISVAKTKQKNSLRMPNLCIKNVYQEAYHL